MEGIKIVLTVLGALGGGALGAWLTARFRRIGDEHLTRFSRLHERRAQALADVYGKLVDLEMALQALTALDGGAPVEELGRQAHDAFVAFGRFEHVALFLPTNTLAPLRAIRQKALVLAARFQWARGSWGGPTNHTAWVAAWGEALHEFPAARRAIEREFREALGERLLPAAASPPESANPSKAAVDRDHPSHGEA